MLFNIVRHVLVSVMRVQYDRLPCFCSQLGLCVLRLGTLKLLKITISVMMMMMMMMMMVMMMMMMIYAHAKVGLTAISIDSL